LDEDKKKGYAAMLKKHAGCLQRSKYAVHRAAARVQQGSEESRQLEALAASADGTVWGGMGNGLLVQWDADGTRLRELTLPPIGVGVKSIVAVGRRLWIGYANGMVQVISPFRKK
jgi:sugar lactone lactonase YvrE